MALIRQHDARTGAMNSIWSSLTNFRYQRYVYG